MRKIFLSVLLILLLAASYGAGFGTHWLISKKSSPQFSLFWEALEILKRDFYKPLPDDRQITYAAIRGVVNQLGDPYTIFLEPQARSLEKDTLKGEFGGIGAWVRKTEDGRFILTPMDGYPAQRAGIKDGDELIRVDETNITPEMSLDQVLILVRGPIGTYVNIVVRRGGEELSFRIRREKIETPSVEWRLLKPELAYIKIATFTERTPKELEQALRNLQSQGASKLVLDLRGNPGGLIESALRVGGYFLKSGVMLHERYKDSLKSYEVEKAPMLVDWPMVVLVDSGTASAAEIVAGALQEAGRAKLIGERTYGKGSVQWVYDLSDGSSLHVTVAQWFTPNYRKVEGNGLEPDIKIEPREGTDAWIEEALLHFGKGGAE